MTGSLPPPDNPRPTPNAGLISRTPTPCSSTALPLIPLYHENQNYLVQTAVHGWEDNAGWHWHPFNGHDLPL